MPFTVTKGASNVCVRELKPLAFQEILIGHLLVPCTVLETRHRVVIEDKKG